MVPQTIHPILAASIGVDDPDTVATDAEYYDTVLRRCSDAGERVRIFLQSLEAMTSGEISRIRTAIEEALTNACVHGNLGRSSEIRDEGPLALQQDLEGATNRELYDYVVRFRVNVLTQMPQEVSQLTEVCHQIIETPVEDAAVDSAREAVEPTVLDEYRLQVLQNTSHLFKNVRGIEIIVGDDGNGFNPDDVADPTDPENLAKPYGRGLMLMRAFMDEVTYNDKGTEVTMKKAISEPSE